MRISIVGEINSSDKFVDDLSYRIYQVKASDALRKLLLEELHKRIKEPVEIYIQGNTVLADLTLRVLKEIEKEFKAKKRTLEVHYVIPNETAFRSLGAPRRNEIVRLLGNRNRITFLDEAYKLPRRTPRDVKELLTRNYLCSNCDTLIHMWRGDIKEIHVYATCLLNINKLRLIMDAETFEVLEMY